MRGALALLVAVLVLGLGLGLAPLGAAADPARARSYSLAGNQAYDAGQYLTAASAYAEAYREDPLPAHLFTLGQCYRRQYFIDGDLAGLQRALGYYRRYLGEVPSGGRRGDAVTHIAAIELLLARAGPRAEPAPARAATQLLVTSRVAGATASIDGGPPAPVPVAAEVTAGTHRVRVAADGHAPAEADWLAVEGRLVLAELEPAPIPARLEVRAPAGAAVLVDGRPTGRVAVLAPGTHEVAAALRGHQPFQRRVELLPGGSATLDAPLVATGRRRAARWLLLSSAVTLGAGLAAGALALDAQGDAAEILDRRAPGRHLTAAELDDYNGRLDRRDLWRGVSIGLVGAAGALVLTGAALWWFDEPALAPTVGRGVAGATWRTRF